jgi:Concanavalin A-like lectin/glucanases superfamily
MLRLRWLLSLTAAGAVGCASLAGLGDYDGGEGSGAATAAGGQGGTGLAGSGAGGTGGSSSSAGAGGLGGAGPTYAEVVAADMPLAHWPMNLVDGSGETPDVTVNPRPFVMTMPYAEVPGLFDGSGGAIQLVKGMAEPNGFGSSDHDAFKFNSKAPFALELWFSVTEPASNAFLFGRAGLQSGIYNGYRLELEGNTLRFQRYPVNGQANTAELDGVVPDVTYHVLGTYDGDCMCLFWIGGSPELARSNCSASPVNLPDTSGPPLRVGSASGLVGVVDELAIYGQPLAPDRMLAHHEAATGQPLADTFDTLNCR